MKRSSGSGIRAGLLLCISMLAVGGVHAQSKAGAAKDAATDMRAVFASPSDVADGKKVAQASCANCHGIDGLSTGPNVPHIAGQRPGYLYAEMRVYQAGGRPDKAMGEAVKFLADDALVKVAAYYASLEPAAPTAVDAKAAARSAKRVDPVQAGKAVAGNCGSCHGEAGVSSMAGMPSLVAFDPKHLYDATLAYKNGQRKHDMMKTIAAGISDADLKNVALFYALQKPARAKTPSTGDEVRRDDDAPGRERPEAMPSPLPLPYEEKRARHDDGKDDAAEDEGVHSRVTAAARGLPWPGAERGRPPSTIAECARGISERAFPLQQPHARRRRYWDAQRQVVPWPGWRSGPT